MPVIKAIVFDMDGVLCRDRLERRLALLASWSGQRPEAIHAAIWRSGFEDEAERGVVSADDDLRGFGERLGSPLSATPWVEARRVAIEPDLAVLARARQLSTDRPVGMFTNNPWLLKRHLAEVFPAVRDRPVEDAARARRDAALEGEQIGGRPVAQLPRLCGREAGRVEDATHDAVGHFGRQGEVEIAERRGV